MATVDLTLSESDSDASGGNASVINCGSGAAPVEIFESDDEALHELAKKKKGKARVKGEGAAASAMIESGDEVELMTDAGPDGALRGAATAGDDDDDELQVIGSRGDNALADFAHVSARFPRATRPVLLAPTSHADPSLSCAAALGLRHPQVLHGRHRQQPHVLPQLLLLRL